MFFSCDVKCLVSIHFQFTKINFFSLCILSILIVLWIEMCIRKAFIIKLNPLPSFHLSIMSTALCSWKILQRKKLMKLKKFFQKTKLDVRRFLYCEECKSYSKRKYLEGMPSFISLVFLCIRRFHFEYEKKDSL